MPSGNKIKLLKILARVDSKAGLSFSQQYLAPRLGHLQSSETSQDSLKRSVSVQQQRRDYSLDIVPVTVLRSTHAIRPHSILPSNRNMASSHQMEQWVTDQDGLENLRQQTVNVPEPGQDEVLVKIDAVSLNYRDTEGQ